MTPGTTEESPAFYRAPQQNSGIGGYNCRHASLRLWHSRRRGNVGASRRDQKKRKVIDSRPMAAYNDIALLYLDLFMVARDRGSGEPADFALDWRADARRRHPASEEAT